MASSITWMPESAPIWSALRTRVDALLGAHAERGHRGVVAGLLLQLEGLLHGVLVELRQQPVDADAVNGVVRLELPVGSGVGNVLHTDNNVHGDGREGPSCALGCVREATRRSSGVKPHRKVGYLTVELSRRGS